MRPNRALPLTLATAVSLVVAAAPARAEDKVAEQLYQDGKAAAAKKDWVVACSKFLESNTREPAPGTLLNLADCEENRGMFVAALGHFEAAVKLSKPGDERVDYAKQRASSLERRAPKLTVKLHASTPSGTTVERDGIAIPPGQIGSPMVIDPGEHSLAVRAPGRAESRGAVTIALGETREIEVSAGMPIPASVTTKPAGSAAVEVTSAPGGDSLKTAAYVALGVGVVGVAFGAVGGLLTMSAKSTADEHCPPQGCDAQGLDAESRGKTWSNISTVGFVLGGVGIATGVVLLIVSPKSSAPATRAAIGGLVFQPTSGGASAHWRHDF